MRVGHSASEVIDVVKAGILDSYAVKQQVTESARSCYSRLEVL